MNDMQSLGQRVRRIAGAGAIVVAVGAGAVAIAAPAGAAANTACPEGFEMITVEAAVEQGYRHTPVYLDAAGNNDGIVCRRPVGDGILHIFLAATVDQIYILLDNVTPRN
jgi:hypothetical protein